MRRDLVIQMAENPDFMTPPMERPRNRRTNPERLAARAELSTLRLQGYTLQEIAQKMGMSYETIKRENRLLETEWLNRSRLAIEGIKAQELAKLDLLESEAWAAWQKSKADYQKRIVEDRPPTVSGSAGRYARIETGPQNGDPRFLSALLSISERRARLLGYDAPNKVALTDPTGEIDRAPAAFPVPPELTLEQWQAHCNAALQIPVLQ